MVFISGAHQARQVRGLSLHTGGGNRRWLAELVYRCYELPSVKEKHEHEE